MIVDGLIVLLTALAIAFFACVIKGLGRDMDAEAGMRR